MKLNILSASSMEGYEKCSMKYYFAKEAKLARPPKTTADIGTCFHQAMEVYINQRYRYSFEQCARQANRTPNMDHFNDSVLEEAIGIGTEWLQYHKMPEPMTLGEPPNEIKFPQAELAFGPPGDVIYGNAVTPANAITFASGLKVHGLIDMIHPEFDRFGNCTMVITDWKTNRYPAKDIHNKRQPQLYALIVHKLTGLPVRVEFWYVRNAPGGPRIYQPSLEDLGKIEQSLLDVQNRIIADTNPIATPSLECKWCDHNYTCEKYTEWLAAPPPTNGHKPTPQTMELIALSELYGFYNDRFLAARQSKYSLQDVLVARMQEQGLKEIGDYYITWSFQTLWTDHAKDVIEEWGGLDMMPDNLKTELIKHHKVRDVGTPFLKKRMES